VLAVLSTACESRQRPGVAIESAAPPPDFAGVAAAHDARVERLARLWTSAVVQLTYTDEDGRRQRDQGEGYLQVIQPDRFALSVGKFGEAYVYVGSNPEFYWWFELRGTPRAWIGRHAGRAALDRDVPIHPLDLLDLLGVTPLARPDDMDRPGGSVSRAEDGSVIVEVPTREPGGLRRVTLDARTFEPGRIELLSSDGRLVAVARLGEYGPVTVWGDGRLPPRTAWLVEVEFPGQDSGLRLRMSNPENRGEAAPLAAFDLDRLLRKYRIDDIRWLDDEAAGPEGDAP